MNAKIPVFLVIVLMFLTGVASGQPSENKSDIQEKVQVAVGKLDASFSLEKSKQNTIKEIFTDFYTQQKELKDHIQGPASGLRQGFAPQNFQSVRKQNEALIIARDKGLKKELTRDQYKKWKSDIEPSLGRKKR